MKKLFSTWTAIVFALAVSGCASGPTTNTNNPDDPLESWNRQVFTMNMKFDHAVLRPVARAYVDVVPEPARQGVHNFLNNLDSPIVFANDLMQGEVKLAAVTVGRFGLNSTLGIGGLVDLGTPAGLPYHNSDFGQTLGVWGVGGDPYLVIPLLGPSNPRDLSGYAVDQFLDPLDYVGIRDYTYWAIGRGALNILDERAIGLGTVDQLEESSVDPYATMRSLYRQYRANKINHGQTNVETLPQM